MGKARVREYVCLLIRNEENKFYLTDYKNRGLWLPIKERRGRYSHYTLTELSIKIIEKASRDKSNLKGLRNEFMDITSRPSRIYAFFYAKVNTDIIKLSSDGFWMSLAEMESSLKPDSSLRLLGPEPIKLAKQGHKCRVSWQTPLLSDGSPEKDETYEELLYLANLGKNEQELLIQEFMDQCHPSQYMNFTTFANYMTTLKGANKDTVEALFRAFAINDQHMLTSKEVLHGLAALEPYTRYGIVPSKLRCHYMFRYYDVNNDGVLQDDEFKSLVKDIRDHKGLPNDEVSLMEKTLNTARLFGKDQISRDDFWTACLKLRKTSILFRLFRLPVSCMTNLRLAEEKSLCTVSDSDSKGEPPLKRSRSELLDSEKPNEDSLFKQPNETALSSAPLQVVKHHLATHSVQVTRKGTVADIQALSDLQGTAAVSGSGDTHLEYDGSSFQRLSSIDAFNLGSQPYKMLADLRYFERATKAVNGTGSKSTSDWGLGDRNAFAKCLLTLCQQVKESLAGEPRLLKLRSPCYILGDIHGNYYDLVAFEKALWRTGPNLTPGSFVFLGNYIDRGDYGIEVVSYLFAQKLLAPDKFYLLRGNHELRCVQKKYNFESECLTKFGKKIGSQIWDAVNECFDVMPLAATVDNKLFCVHGGIPSPENGGGNIEAINRIPSPLSDPEVESPLAWELLWNDPLSSSAKMKEASNQELCENHGFTFNTRRGTARFFSCEALCAFLEANGVSHVIRSHKVQATGFKVQQDGKLLTIFSSSRYCGRSNEAACVLVDSYKLHLIRIDTS